MLLLSTLFQFGIAWLLLTDLNGMESDSGNTINKEIEKKRALVIAPNFLEVHFKMLSVFANVLTEEFNVHFLILNTKNENRKNFNRGIDTKIFKQVNTLMYFIFSYHVIFYLLSIFNFIFKV
uniref:Glucuronosyltransferase n=1 Tax=Meloidogyne javanica TaxID=6303 RepID=Q5QH01_MELJA|nr:unknown released protein 1 [Meloidogyne javanica]